MNFKEFLLTEMTWDEFLRLKAELPNVVISIFGKKNVKVYPTDDIQFQMGTRWGSLKLSKGGKQRFEAESPRISMSFQWDKTGKSGPIPDGYEGDTVWEGSFAFARALKQIARWAKQNGIGMSFGAEPDRTQAYSRILNSMGFQQTDPTKKAFYPTAPANKIGVDNVGLQGPSYNRQQVRSS
jgi:hypothetical protein